MRLRKKKTKKFYFCYRKSKNKAFFGKYETEQKAEINREIFSRVLGDDVKIGWVETDGFNAINADPKVENIKMIISI